MLASLPLFLRHLPARVADSAYWRICRPRQQHPRYAALFAAAPLRYAPGMRMRLDPGDHMHGIIAFTGVYERQLSMTIRDRALRGGTFVDVGANWGYFSLLWASANPANRVVAIEASPRNGAPLKENIRRNGLGGRVVVHETAAGARNGTIRFDPGPEGETGWGGIAPAGAARTIAVPVARLDDLCGGIERVAVMKIDVEGAEALVLAGSSRMLAEKRVGEIFLEINGSRMAQLGIAPDEPSRLLAANGYRCTLHGSDLHAVAT
jgi:FkbM family methyltransferase